MTFLPNSAANLGFPSLQSRTLNVPHSTAFSLTDWVSHQNAHLDQVGLILPFLKWHLQEAGTIQPFGHFVYRSNWFVSGLASTT